MNRLISKEYIDNHILLALNEDIKEGDYSSLCCIDSSQTSRAELIAKQEGIICGIEIAKRVFELLDPKIEFTGFKEDGDKVEKGDRIFTVKGNAIGILSSERTALNYLQRLSGISSTTNIYVKAIEGTNTKLLDTRKTTPGLRLFEKYAVKIGGGYNHRMGLFDMIMLKDNHIDFAGGIENAITRANDYIRDNNLDIRIEIEVRNFNELKEVLSIGRVNRIMLDNFTPSDLKKAIEIIDGRYETESSGGITLETIKDYAISGVDYISVGALTHNIKSLDLSLIAY
ncbi:MAG: carboxylating nicotinate-nucleotide diphosphorylase [Bacteroidales bacterium]|jgi:nicotinate-nucleotide pyrophosphorylase (carboxylating)|nr:carboxylating nicotinate-nucleotide diphosphorylase [Bacteroidales bacterium]MDD3724446.1 carboxylating nicotinate-nucleotide diphosphorylase [Bacteroidales bacterium]MDY0053275.1 carboxylating nicotinate-nucleotide diphosphorylase [Bacteroidales bacterium]